MRQGANESDVYLPDSKKVSIRYNESDFDPQGGSVAQGSLNSFSIDKVTYSSKYTSKGEFMGYYNDKGEIYENPDITMSSGSGFSGKFLIRLDLRADISGVPAADYKIIQLCSTTPLTTKVLSFIPLYHNNFIKGQYLYEVSGNKLAGEVDGGIGSYFELQYKKVADRSGPYLRSSYKLNNELTGGSIRFFDIPGAKEQVEKIYFKTMIVAMNYMGSGEDLVLKSITWGWTMYGTAPLHGKSISKDEVKVTETDANIIKHYYPSHKLW